MANRDNYQLLIDKLDGFIRKYYLNQLIRGLLYSLGVVGVLFLTVSLLEHYFYFDRAGRKLLFFSFLGLSVLAFAGWVLLPLGRYFRLGQRISHDQAAQIIGRHFHNVEDKLLNILQLRRQAEEHQADAALLFASINQKAEEIRPVPFPRAIDLGQNRRYLKYALPPLLVLLVLLFAAPSVIRDSTDRLIHNGQDFERPAPFQFILPEQDLSVVQFEDYLLEVEIAGDALPDQVMIEVDNYTYRLSKEAPNRFSYRFNKVQEDTPFRLAAGPVTSRDYDLTVLKKPNISSFEVQLDYPAYTGRRDETLNNIGDLSVPAGTAINWVFNTQYTERIEMRFGAAAELAEVRRFDDDLFTYEKRALRSEMYKLYVSNASLPLADSTAYNLAVVPDLYPEISVERFQDSTVRRLFYFVGEASDDYGLTKLTFNYRKGKRGGEAGELITVPIQGPEGKQTRYDYTWDLNELQLEAGDQLTYYFEIFDNDGVVGAKSARTGIMTYNVPTKKELSQQEEANDQRIKNDLEKALQESREIQDEMKKMREKLLQEKEMDWKTRKEVEKMLERQKELQKQIESAKQAYQENLENQQDFSETEENILEKQEQLQKLFEESLSEEMQQLMQDIQEMLDQLEKDEALEMMEDMELSDEEMEKELDRMLELFKQLELEQEMQETVEQLEELAKEQEELAEETQQTEEQQEQQSAEEQQDQQSAEEQQATQEELQEQQQAIEEKFDDIQEKMEQMQEKNEALETPMQLDDMQQEQESVKQEMQNSQQQLQQQENKKASESMQNAGQKMKQMANQMQMQMQSQQMEQMQEDMDALRQLLENIVGLSFNQEELMEQFDETRINTPRYVELVQEQFKLKDDFTIVEDSLQALAKRVFQIESFVTEKVTDIKSNLRDGLEELEERRKSQAAEQQQRAMTNLNDLALMLSETMENMQQQMSGMMSGQQMCQNPGASGQGNQQQGPKDKMSQGQQGINEQLKKMRDRMKSGGERGTAKEFAQMAARQAALRKALEEKQKQLREQGQGSQELQELIDKMDRAEEDLVNKRLRNETMERQEDILTRLLEHEKAERERKMKEERESQTAQQRSRELPPSLQEYIKKREAEIDMFRQVSPSLKPYYKQLVDEYFQSLQADQ